MSGSDPYFSHDPSEDRSRPEHAREISNPLNTPLFSHNSSLRIRAGEELRDCDLLTKFSLFKEHRQYSSYPEMGDELKVLARDFVTGVSRILYKEMRRAGIADPSIDLALESCGIHRTPLEEDCFALQGFLGDEAGTPVVIGYDAGIERTTGAMGTLIIGRSSLEELTMIPQISTLAHRELIDRDQPSWVWYSPIRTAIIHKIDLLVEKQEINPKRIELFDVDRLFQDDKVVTRGSRVELLIEDDIYEFVLEPNEYGTPQCKPFVP